MLVAVMGFIRVFEELAEGLRLLLSNMGDDNVFVVAVETAGAASVLRS